MKHNRQDEALLSPVLALAKAIADACETHSLSLLTAASALYWIVVGLIATHKQLDNDEIFTLYLARLPSLAAVWSALLTGAEQLTPFFYLLLTARAINVVWALFLFCTE